METADNLPPDELTDNADDIAYDGGNAGGVIDFKLVEEMLGISLLQRHTLVDGTVVEGDHPDPIQQTRMSETVLELIAERATSMYNLHTAEKYNDRYAAEVAFIQSQLRADFGDAVADLPLSLLSQPDFDRVEPKSVGARGTFRGFDILLQADPDAIHGCHLSVKSGFLALIRRTCRYNYIGHYCLQEFILMLRYARTLLNILS
jgi:hypothetical protein